MSWYCNDCNTFRDVYRNNTVLESVTYSREDKELSDNIMVENLDILEEGEDLFCNTCGSDNVEWLDQPEQKKQVNKNYNE